MNTDRPSIAHFALVLLLLGIACNPGPRGRLPSDTKAPEILISLSARPGYFSDLDDFLLTVDSNGAASLWVTHLNLEPRLERQWMVAPEQMDHFRQAVDQADFFGLDSTVGVPVHHSGYRKLTIQLGAHSHTVEAHELKSKWDDPHKQMARFARLWGTARGWFNDHGLVDYRCEDVAEFGEP